MLQGVVNARLEGVLTLRVRGPTGTTLDVQAVVDSGFTAAFTLPPATIAALGLVRQSGSSAVLADGTVRHFDIYEAEVVWGTGWRPVLVSGVGAEVLLGMRLLSNHELRMVVVPGGAVEITPLP